MKNTFAVCTVLVVVLAGVSWCPASEPADAHTRFAHLERDIPSLYLMNGLFLSSDQYGRLAEILSSAAELENTVQKKAEALGARAASNIDREAHRVASGEKPGRRPYELHPVSEPRPKDVVDEVRSSRAEATKKRAKLAGEVQDLLTGSQKAILGNFIPCFIPPQDFKNPVRVGQVKDQNGPGQKVLERLRSAPEPRLNEARDKALEIITGYVMEKRKVTYSDEARKKVYDELSRNLDGALPKIRSMSDADFALEKSALVDQIMPIECEAKPEALQQDKDLHLVEAYLLNPGCLDVVQSRAPASALKAVRPADGGLPDELMLPGRQKMRTAMLLSKLGLTSEQRSSLLPILRAAASARDKREKDIRQAESDALATYEALRKELAAQNPTPQIEDAARENHRRVKELQGPDMVNDFRPFEKQMDALLSKDQIDFLMTARGRGMKPGAQSESANAEREESVANGETRPAAYGHKYTRGEPVPVLDPSTEALFSDEAVHVLEGMSRNPGQNP